MNRVRTHGWRGARGWALRIAGVLAAAGLLFLQAGCEPRKIEPQQIDRVVAAVAAQTEYRRVELPNGLKVMLISDPDAERSAASLAVGVGSLSDPKDRPGLAHFLEHMLFLGTKKYPEPEGYQQFVNQHAGFTNAYTADDHTNFFFQVADEAFPEALDRFAQFFVAPLFTPGYVAREMNAVDSEHSKNIENDGWRVNQVIRDQFDPQHPIHRFATGNLETLKGVTREELLAFYHDHYSSNVMTLAVIGHRSLDDLEKLVRGRFVAVENRHLEKPHFPEVFLKPKAALRLVTVEPVADQRSMTITFPLPPSFGYYDAKPLQLLSFVLGHEGPGSLLSLLKAKDYASSLAAGSGEATADYSSLDLRIGLTPEGLKHYEDVLAEVFGAIRYFRSHGFPHYIYEENQIMADLDFRYQPKDDAASRVTGMSALMQTIPMADLPKDAFLYSRFDPALIGKFLDRLIPDNALVTLVAKGVPTDRTEPFYQAKYGYEERTGADYQRLVAARPDAKIAWPEPNQFIPHVSGLRRPEGPLKWAYTSQIHLRRDGVAKEIVDKLAGYEGVGFTGLRAFLTEMDRVVPAAEQEAVLPVLLQDALPIPVRLMDSERGKVWFMPDWRFRQPRAEMILTFRTPSVYGTPHQAVLAALYAFGWDEALNEFGYAVKQAGLSYKLEATKIGMQLTLSGYSPRMLELLDHLVATLRQVEITQETFESILERYRRAIQNQRFGQPYQQAGYYRKLLLADPTFPREALEAELDKVSLGELQAYARRLYDRVYLEGVVVGSLDPNGVRVALNSALDTLGGAVLPAAERQDESIRQLPGGANYVYTERLDINNSLIDVGYQVGKTDPTLRGATLIAGRALQESFFFNMRTQQQLGYIVYAGMGQMKKTLGLVFLIQSGAYTADDLLSRVDAYIPRFVAEFKAMPDDRFERYRTAVIDAKLQRDKDLDQLAGRLQWIAFENDEKWDYVSEDIQAVEALTREQVNAVLEKALLGSRRGRLVIRLVGKDHVAGPVRGTPIRSPEQIKAEAG